MRWRRIAFWVTFSTLALIVLALSWLWTADLGVFKPQLERLVTQELGHEFEIRGEFHVDLARQTTLIAEDLHFANAAWADADDMVTIGRAEVRIDLRSLFQGLILIELLDLDDTNILLLNPGDRAPNWERLAEWFAEPSSVEVLLGVVDIDRLRLRLDSAERERPLNLEVAYFDQSHRDDGFLDLRLDAMLDGKVVRAEGELGSWDALVAGKNLEFDVEAVLDTFDFSAAGRIDDVASPLRPEFQFSAAGPDIDDLTRMLGLGEEGDGDIKLAGALNPIVDGPLSLNIKGNLGQTEIDAVGEVADLRSLEKLQLKATASGPDLGRVLRLAGIHQVREAPFMLKFDAEMEDGRFDVREAMMVFADARIEGTARVPRFPSIDDATIRLGIEGSDIERFRYITGMPGAASGPFSLGFTVDVRDDGVEVLNLEARTSLGELRGSGSIGDPDTFLGTEFNVRVNTDSLSKLAGAYGVEDMPDKAAEISGAAKYTADGIRTNGPVSMDVDGTSVQVDGLITLQDGIRGTDVVVKSSGPDLAQLVAMFAEPTGVPALSFDVSSRLRVRGDGYRLTDLAGSLGTASLAGEGLLVPADLIAGSWFDVVAHGPDFEEIVGSISDVEVRPGPFELESRITFSADAIELDKFKLDREFSNVRLDLIIGVDRPESYLDFDVTANGRDVRSVLRNVKGLETFEQPFSLEGKGWLRGKHWDFERVNGTVGQASFAARGDLALEDASARTEFIVSLSVPNLADIGTLDGRRFNAQALALEAHAVGSNGLLTIDGMRVHIGNSDINGSVVYRAGDVPEMSAEFQSDKLVILPLLEDKQDYDPEPEFDDGRLIPDVKVPFDAMKSVNASLLANIGELQRKNLYLRDIEVVAQLQDGALDVQTARFRARSGEIAVLASLSPAGGQGEASLQAVARNFASGLFATNADLAMTSDLDLDLRATGTDLRALAGSANGVVYLDMRGGRVELNEMITAIYGNMLEEMLNTMNPIQKENPYTDFECLIVPLDVADGKVTGVPSIFASTEKIRVVAQGSVNLKTEEIRIGVRTTPRQIVSISAAELFNPYVQVVGTLASPRLAVDEAGILITGGAAVATGGLSLLARGLWDRLSKSGDACKQVSKQALKALEGRVPVMEIPDAGQSE
jgi:uncharacterized protein involved in outer membrane biogenesis